MKTNFHNKNFALGLDFIVRPEATRKWPISMFVWSGQGWGEGEGCVERVWQKHFFKMLVGGGGGGGVVLRECGKNIFLKCWWLLCKGFSTVQSKLYNMC